MEYLVTAQEMKRYDEAAISRIGIPALVLMERAALSVREEINKRGLGDMAFGKRKTALIVSGCGNNGADSLALARLLSEEGWQVEAIICGRQEKATDQWRTQRAILEKYPVETGSKPQRSEYTILIDALFGVGLSREVQGEFAELICLFNRLEGYKIALDVPSGIHSDTGQELGCAVRADLTVTFAFAKRGLFLREGRSCAGEVAVKDIGIGPAAFFGEEPGCFRYTEPVRELLPHRAPDGNKGTFGKVVLAAGSRNMAGAAVLAARSCYRAGAGMVKVITPQCNRVILQTAVPEALLDDETGLERGMEWADVIAIGPGLGTDGRGEGLLRTALCQSVLPIVIDADGLNLLASSPSLQEITASSGAQGRPVILTPHVGELARLCSVSTAECGKNVPEYAMGLAKRLNCVIVSKDARTFTCMEGKKLCMNTSGNSAMATAGSGDVLTGIIAGLLAQGMGPFEAAGVGVYLHGLAGDKAAGRLGEYAVTAGDIIEGLAWV